MKQTPRAPKDSQPRQCKKRRGSNIGWGHRITMVEWFQSLACLADSHERPMGMEGPRPGLQRLRPKAPAHTAAKKLGEQAQRPVWGAR